MSLTIDCGEGKHEVCSGSGRHHYLIPQLDDETSFECDCPCHKRARQDGGASRRMDYAYIPTFHDGAKRGCDDR